MKTDRWPPLYEVGDVLDYSNHRVTDAVRKATVTKCEDGFISLSFDDEHGKEEMNDQILAALILCGVIDDGDFGGWKPGCRMNFLHKKGGGKSICVPLVKREAYTATFMIDGEEVDIDVDELRCGMKWWLYEEIDRLEGERKPL